MRRLLGVLRDEASNGGTLAPQPGTAQLPTLVDQVAQAGLPAVLSVEGEDRPLTSAIDVTVYRLAQEALTNVLKHAGEVSSVDVRLSYRDDAVELVVRDDGRGPRSVGDGRGAGSATGGGGAHSARDSRGHGLVGMRERVDMHDGSLAAGPRAEGGFEVRAVLPTDRVAAPA